MAVEHLAPAQTRAVPVPAPGATGVWAVPPSGDLAVVDLAAPRVADLAPTRRTVPPADLTSTARAVADAVADLARAVRSVEALGTDPSRAEELTAALGLLDAAASTLGVARTSLSGLVRATQRWRGTSRARDFADWRGAANGQGRGAAVGEQRDHEAMVLLPTVKEAALSGSITHGHLSAVAAVLGGASENARRRLVQVEDQILHAATQLPVPQLRRSLAALATSYDADAADAEFHETRAQRFLRLTPHRGAVKVDGLLDVVSGETLRTALEALTPAPSPEDGRSPEQRRADALVDLAGKALSTGIAKAGAQIRPHLSVLLREDTLHLLTVRRALDGANGNEAGIGGGDEDAAARGGGGESAGGGAGARGGGGAERSGTGRQPIAGLTGEAWRRSGLTSPPPLAELAAGTLLPHAALEVLACDALVQRVVLDPNGQPLDVGRTQRTYTGDLRRAASARDRHCQWPGCTLRATWCEVHHLRRWSDGGDTSLGNAITLCTRHHHDVHRDRVHISPAPGGFVFTEPDGTRIGSTTRLLDHLLVPRPRPEPWTAEPRPLTSTPGHPPLSPEQPTSTPGHPPSTSAHAPARPEHPTSTSEHARLTGEQPTSTSAHPPSTSAHAPARPEHPTTTPVRPPSALERPSGPSDRVASVPERPPSPPGRPTSSPPDDPLW